MNGTFGTTVYGLTHPIIIGNYVRKESSGRNHVYRVLEPVINKVHKTSCGGEELIESADLEVNTTILVW